MKIPTSFVIFLLLFFFLSFFTFCLVFLFAMGDFLNFFVSIYSVVVMCLNCDCRCDLSIVMPRVLKCCIDLGQRLVVLKGPYAFDRTLKSNHLLTLLFFLPPYWLYVLELFVLIW